MDNLTAEMIVMRKNLEYLQDNTNHFFLIVMACIIFRKYQPVSGMISQSNYVIHWNNYSNWARPLFHKNQAFYT